MTFLPVFYLTRKKKKGGRKERPISSWVEFKFSTSIVSIPYYLLFRDHINFIFSLFLSNIAVYGNLNLCRSLADLFGLTNVVVCEIWFDILTRIWWDGGWLETLFKPMHFKATSWKGNSLTMYILIFLESTKDSSKCKKCNVIFSFVAITHEKSTR